LWFEAECSGVEATIDSIKGLVRLAVALCAPYAANHVSQIFRRVAGGASSRAAEIAGAPRSHLRTRLTRFYRFYPVVLRRGPNLHRHYRLIALKRRSIFRRSGVPSQRQSRGDIGA
jgi:hypothetical protein